MGLVVDHLQQLEATREQLGSAAASARAAGLHTFAGAMLAGVFAIEKAIELISSGRLERCPVETGEPRP